MFRLPRTARGTRPGSGTGHWPRTLLLALLLLAGNTTASGAAIVVIAQPGTDLRGINQRDLASIFRRKLQISPRGQVLVPVNLPVGHPLRQRFTRQLMGRSPESMQDFWNEQYFNGITPPYVLASQEAAIRFVSRTPGAIAYILDCRLDARVEAILRLPLKGDPPPGLQALCP